MTCVQHAPVVSSPSFQYNLQMIPPPYIRDRENVESKAISQVKGPAIIISSSGMLTGRRIKHHLLQNIARPESTLLFVGYQAVGTLGRLIPDGVTPIRLLGQSLPVRIQTERKNPC